MATRLSSSSSLSLSSLELSDTKVYEPQIRGTTAYLCEVVVVEFHLEQLLDDGHAVVFFFITLKIQKSMSLKHEPASEPLHVSMQKVLSNFTSRSFSTMATRLWCAAIIISSLGLSDAHFCEP